MSILTVTTETVEKLVPQEGALPRLTAERPCVSLNGRPIFTCDLTITFPEEESA